MPKILVVDDEQDIVQLVKDRLETKQYEVISASDGEEGIKMAKNDKPDLILMDIMMPKMSGGIAVSVLQQDEETKNIPVIFLTGVYSNAGLQGEEGRGVNVAGQYFPCIGKPFDGDELVDKVEEFLAS